eukprot:6665774-Prorocentrum_lima.AAC.1
MPAVISTSSFSKPPRSGLPLAWAHRSCRLCCSMRLKTTSANATWASASMFPTGIDAYLRGTDSAVSPHFVGGVLGSYQRHAPCGRQPVQDPV